MGLGVVRVESQGLAQAAGGVLGPALLGEGDAEVVVGLVVVGAQGGL